jgi:thioredoxin-related protein
MKFKVLLILIIFIISMFLVACKSNTKLDVDGYREGLKSSQKKSMPTEKKKEIEKNIFPNIKQK